MARTMDCYYYVEYKRPNSLKWEACPFGHISTNYKKVREVCEKLIADEKFFDEGFLFRINEFWD